jgi:hypothetical protein
LRRSKKAVSCKNPGNSFISGLLMGCCRSSKATLASKTLGRLTGTRCLPFRLAQHLGLLGPELSTACVNLCGQVTIRASEYRCVMSLYAFLPRKQENLQHQVDPRAKGAVRVPRLNRSLGSGRDWTSAENAPLPQCLALHRGSARDLWISTSPIWRLLLSQRLMVELETPKRAWTSFLGMPRSMAESTFNLRFFE